MPLADPLAQRHSLEDLVHYQGPGGTPPWTHHTSTPLNNTLSNIRHTTLNTPHFNATKQHTVQYKAHHPEHTTLQRHWTTHCHILHKIYEYTTHMPSVHVQTNSMLYVTTNTKHTLLSLGLRCADRRTLAVGVRRQSLREAALWPSCYNTWP